MNDGPTKPRQFSRSPQRDERIVQLEEVLTHQQRLLQQLSDVVAQQHDDLRGLRSELDAFKQHVRQLTEDLETGLAEGPSSTSDTSHD